MKQNLKNTDGMAALLTVIVIGMAALTMSVASSVISLDSLEAHYSSDKGREALLLADGCIADALRKIKLDSSSLPLSYALATDNGTCQITMPDNGTVLSVGQVDNHTKHLRARITVSGSGTTTSITLDNWQEE